MRSIVLSVFSFLFPLVLAGCVGLGVPQEPRFEISESARVLMIRPQSLFFPPHLVTLDRRADGSVIVHAHSDPSSRLGLRSLREATFSDANLAQLHEALIPFLVPACGPPLR